MLLLQKILHAKNFILKLSFNKWLRKIKDFLLWLLIDFSGARFVIYKIRPQLPDEDKVWRKPTNFSLWVLGLYIAAFGLASQRYENKVGKIENRVSATVSQLSTSDKKAFRNLIGSFTDLVKLKRPHEPELFNPLSVYKSFLNEYDSDNQDTINWLHKTLETWKKSLNEVYLRRIDLTGIDLRGANLEGASLFKVNLNKSDLSYINLKGAELWDVKLDGANFYKANLEGAKLRIVSAKNAIIRSSNFMETDLTEVDLNNSKIIHSSFRGAKIEDSSFDHSCFFKTTFDESSLKKVSFDKVLRDVVDMLKCLIYFFSESQQFSNILSIKGRC